MAPSTRLAINKGTSTAKFNIPSENNSCFGKNVIFSKRKAEHSPPKSGILKRVALLDLTNGGRTQKVKSINTLDKKVTTDKLLKSVSKNELSLISKNKVPTGLRLPPRASNVQPRTITTSTKVSSTALKNSTNTKELPIVKKNASLAQASRENKPSNNIYCARMSMRPKSSMPPPHKSKVPNVAEKLTISGEVIDQRLPSVSAVFQDTSNVIGKTTRVTRNSQHKTKIQQAIDISIKSEAPIVKEVTAVNIKDTTRVEMKDLSNRVPVSINEEKQSCQQGEKDEYLSNRRYSARLKELAEKENEGLFANEETKIECRRVNRISTRLSFSKKSLTADKTTDSSLYFSALEDITGTSPKDLVKSVRNEKNIENNLTEFDKELLHDPYQVSLYAKDIFQYLKDREVHFAISDYMPKFSSRIDEDMRAILVDWMVEVQENFELNHETLYLSVKIVDMYMFKAKKVDKSILQLIAITALFLACKYDERLSPAIEDFVFICDGAYKQTDIISMEQTLLESVNFELSFPISYSFLRRYARCLRVEMPLLTLARYILELSLMEYSTVTLSDSKLAAASLYLAFQMVNHDDWTESLTQYSGYKLGDVKDIVMLLNNILHKPDNKKLQAIKIKYSNEVFFKVAEIPAIADSELKEKMDKCS